MLFRNPLWLYVSQVGARILAVLDGVYAFVGSVVYTLVVRRLLMEELAMLTVFKARYAIALTILATSLPRIYAFLPGSRSSSRSRLTPANGASYAWASLAVYMAVYSRRGTHFIKSRCRST